MVMLAIVDPLFERYDPIDIGFLNIYFTDGCFTDGCSVRGAAFCGNQAQWPTP